MKVENVEGYCRDRGNLRITGPYKNWDEFKRRLDAGESIIRKVKIITLSAVAAAYAIARQAVPEAVP